MLSVENESETNVQELNKTVDDFSLFDDNFMSIVFDRNIEATEFLLNIILERDDMEVMEVIGQREYKNPVVGGRSIRISMRKILQARFMMLKYSVQMKARMCIELDSIVV